MKRIIYYFSGTGNSLIVARDIAREINGDLVSISEIINNDDNIITDKDMIGIVFPVYNQGIPSIIRKFVAKLDYIDGKYIFAVCTHGGSPGISLQYLNEYIKEKGSRLSAGYAVKMPYNYITPSMTFKNFFSSFKLRDIPIEKQQNMFCNWDAKLKDIKEDLISKRSRKIETQDEIIEKLVDMLNLRNTLQKKAWLKVAGVKGNTNMTFEESIHLMDCGFWYDEKCTGCEICSEVCPVNNINMIDSKPIWTHQCEQCFACLQWCPNEAIQYRGGTCDGKRYHHPRVKLADMILKNEKISKNQKEESV